MCVCVLCMWVCVLCVCVCVYECVFHGWGSPWKPEETIGCPEGVVGGGYKLQMWVGDIELRSSRRAARVPNH